MSRVLTAAGSIVTRSLRPLPSRITIWLAPKSTSFTLSQQAETRAVEQERHDPRHAIQPLEDGTGLVAGQDHGQVVVPGADSLANPIEESGRAWSRRACFAHDPRPTGRRPVEETTSS